jgi:lysophospholipid acyltransferase (LPLAT)-like uncharacterized protein
MSLRKRLLKSPVLREIACRAAARYIRLVTACGRWTVEGRENIEPLIAAGRPFIACFWHGRLMMVPLAWRYDQRMHIVVSRHRDGALISRVVARFGIATIAGSSSKGGARALRGMLAALAAGDCVGVTPDGPRGPRMRAAAGVVQAARLAGVPIVPVSFGASRRLVMSSWDSFVVPLPFARGAVILGAPIPVPDDGDAAVVEETRRLLEDRLNALTRATDLRFAATPIEPAPARNAAGLTP